MWESQCVLAATRYPEADIRERQVMADCCPMPARLSGSYSPFAAASLASASSLPMPRRDAMAANASGLGFALPDYLPVTRQDRLLTFFGVEYSKEELLRHEVFPLGMAPFIRLPGSPPSKAGIGGCVQGAPSRAAGHRQRQQSSTRSRSQETPAFPLAEIKPATGTA